MILINGTEFDLYNYQITSSGIVVTINGATTAALDEAIGEAANISITDEYRGNNMLVASMVKRYGQPIQHEIEFVKPDLQDLINQVTSELELQAMAIAELAEMANEQLVQQEVTEEEDEEEEEEEL